MLLRTTLWQRPLPDATEPNEMGHHRFLYTPKLKSVKDTKILRKWTPIGRLDVLFLKKLMIMSHSRIKHKHMLPLRSHLFPKWKPVMHRQKIKKSYYKQTECNYTPKEEAIYHFKMFSRRTMLYLFLSYFTPAFRKVFFHLVWSEIKSQPKVKLVPSCSIWAAAKKLLIDVFDWLPYN